MVIVSIGFSVIWLVFWIIVLWWFGGMVAVIFKQIWTEYRYHRNK